MLRRNLRPNTVLTLGLIALALANLSRYLLHRNGRPETNLTDGVEGLAFGIAIATVLLGLHLKRSASRRQ
jgi:cyanate permease